MCLLVDKHTVQVRVCAFHHLQLQDSLRSLVLSSLQAFLRMVLDACHPTLNLDDDYEWGSDLSTSPFRFDVPTHAQA